MPATKKGSATSKTAHVMNLLNKNRENPPADPPAAPAGADPVPAPAGEPSPPKKAPASPVDMLHRDAQASDQIKSALEEAFAQETGISFSSPPHEPDPSAVPDPAPKSEPQPEPEPPAASEPAPESEPQPEPEPPAVSEPAPESGPEPESPAILEPAPESEPQPEPESPAILEPAPESEPQPEPESPAVSEPAPESEPQPEPEPPAAPEPPPEPNSQPEAESPAAPETEDPVTYVNVMQFLVEQNTEKYMKLLGVCTCSRCTADVKALSLTNLQPKYVALPESEVNAWLTLYSGRFQTTVTAQIMRACEIVMETPRH